MQGQKALGFHQKYLNLCSEDERRSYRVGRTWGWLINDRIFICKIASPTSRCYCVFQLGYQNVSLPCLTLNSGLPRVLKNSQFTFIKCKAIKSFKYVKWYKKSLNYNFKRSYSWRRKDKNGDTAGLNFKRQWCHWINMSAAHFKVKTRHRCLYVNVSLKGTVSTALKCSE